MEYNVDYFIKKFEAIPEENWCVDKFRKLDDFLIKEKRSFLGINYSVNKKKIKKTFCAQGHCMDAETINWIIEADQKKISRLEIMKSYPEWKALVDLFGIENTKFIVGRINNGEDIRYQQPTAKKRVLKALYDLKEKESTEFVNNILKITDENYAGKKIN